MIRLLLMLATALGVVWVAGRVDLDELRADPVGAIVGQLRVVSPLAKGLPPAREVVAPGEVGTSGEVVAPPPPFREREERVAPPPRAPATSTGGDGTSSPEPPLRGDRSAEAAATRAPSPLDREVAQQIHGRLDRVMALAAGGEH